jgi:hypothetical protein
MKKHALLLLILFSCFQRALAVYTTVTVSSGFNSDIIANGIGAASASATAFDVPNNYAFVSADFKTTPSSSVPTYALPSNGLINSAATTGLSFQLGGFGSNNALLLSSTVSSGILSFSATGIADIYMLAASANGSSNLTATIHFSDATSQTIAPLTVNDWYDGSGYAIEGVGRVSLTSNGLEGASDDPRLYQLVMHLDPLNFTKTITGITFAATLTGGTTAAVLGLTTNSACSGTPAAGVVASSTTNACAGVDFTLSLNGFVADGGITYQWQTSPDSTTWTSVASGGTDGTYTTSQSAATYYRAIITCSGSNLSATSSAVLVSQNPPNQCYCVPFYFEGCSAFGESFDINSVHISGENGTAINNSGTGCSASNAYSDYSSTVAAVNLTPYSNYTLALTSDNSSASSDMFVTAWIDLNSDGVFDDNTERVATTGSGAALSMTLSVHTDTVTGLHRMRIRAVFDNFDVVDDPCGAYDEGETEDYMVNILPTPTCLPPTNITSADNSNGTSSDISWAGATGASYDYAVDQNNGNAPQSGTTIANVNSTAVNIPSLSGGVGYYFHIRAHCSATDSSAWVAVPFSISSTCGNAAVLAMGSTTTGNNATFSDATLPAGSCGSGFSGTYTAAWYKITPSISGTIAVSTVGNTDFDSYLRVYSGDCSNLTCVGFDDDYGDGNNSFLTFSATAGMSYYILMASYGSGETGNFSLKVGYLPTNDDAPAAILLTPGAGCAGAAYTNLGATVSTSEPIPDCNGSVGVSPVWFKFLAPNSGTARITTDMSIQGGLTDSKIGLFLTTDSSDYSTFSLLACDEDNGTVGSGQMSTIFATGLTPGATYYVEVDDGNQLDAGGSFCITVDEINPSMLSTSAVSCGSLQQPVGDNSAYAGWITLADNNGNLVALVKNPSGSAPSDFSGAYTVNGTGIRQDANGTYYLNRNYFINNSLISTPVDVQLFFSPGEYGYLNGITGGTVSMPDLNVTKQEGSTCAADYNQGLGAVSVLTQISNGSANSVGWIQVSTSSFSNFYIMGGNAPLLIELTNIAAINEGSSNKVTWSTASENPGDYFELERSMDAQTFSLLSRIDANQKPSAYTYNDNTPFAGINYYRLKMISSSGKTSYSKVVQATVTSKGTISIEAYPNPTNKMISLKVYGSSNGDVSVTDISGRVIYQVKMKGAELGLDMSSLVNGVYLVHYVDDNLNKVIKINKQ